MYEDGTLVIRQGGVGHGDGGGNLIATPCGVSGGGGLLQLTGVVFACLRGTAYM